VPSRLAGLGKRRAKRSRKVLAGQKRNVAPGATERRAHSNGKASHIETTEGARRSEARERHFFWVAHGQSNIGFVSHLGSEFTARDADGRKIGLLENLAISDRCRGAP
jgi:hypothetical protein